MPPDHPPDPSLADPALAEEQAHLDHAYACLDAMRATTERLMAVGGGATEVDDEVARYHLRKRIASYDGKAPLAFGRLDTDDRETFHVGRRHVEDANGDPVVVDWRAPVSAPFYRATWSDPLGLHLRRRYSIDGRMIIALHDEDFTDPDSIGGGGIPDPLLAELERSRTGEMRDIVATIQAEQDEIIRAPLDRVTIVQGGPGSGKTAVGLHRAAFLLYEHRLLLEDQRVLVLGPNRVFLRYISEVLPSLGESAVVQTTIEDLVGARYPVRAVDEPEVAALKGDPRMAEVIRRALTALIKAPTDDLELHLPWGRVRLSADDVRSAIETATARSLDFNAAREVFRSLLARRVEALLLPQFRGEAPAGSDFIADARNHDDLKRLITKAWPTTSAPVLVRRLLRNRRALAAAAEGILDSREQALLQHPATEVPTTSAPGRGSKASKSGKDNWTAADIPLLDEADALISGVRATYGHIVVDEAQDLSAMALRMVARRSPRRSLTVLGDLAQSTLPGGQESWADAAEHLGAPDSYEVTELEVGYRVPAAVLDYASRLLPLAAPHVVPSRSIRQTGDEPWVTSSTPAAWVANVVERAGFLASEWGSVGVIAPPSMTGPVLDAARAAGLDVAAAERGGLDRAIAVLDPPTAKGLEFDAVVLVEPSRFIEGEGSVAARGARLLYIAMTRCVQHLSVIHVEPLPTPLRG